MRSVVGSSRAFTPWLAVTIITALCGVSHAQESIITFDNQSGEPALVKLIGPALREAEVPATGKTTVTAGPGRYHIRVRYGTQGKYRYTKGKEFDVTESATTRSRITITLHKVPHGNYETELITAEDFDSIPSPRVVTVDPTKLTPGRWKGRTDTDHGYLEVSFVVDPKNALVQEIKTKGGWKTTSFPGWTWPSHDKVSAEIQADGRFVYKDAWGNLIRGRFTSNESAEGEVPARMQVKPEDGSFITPPSSWCASPSSDTVRQTLGDDGKDWLAEAKAIASLYPESDVVMSKQNPIVKSNDKAGAWFIVVNSTPQNIADFYLHKLKAEGWSVGYQSIREQSGDMVLLKPGVMLQIWLATAPNEGQTNVSVILSKTEKKKE